jgi:hypothetical protein
MPIVDFAFTMPTTVHYGKSFEVAISKSQHTEKANVVWTLSKNGESCSYIGELSKAGGTIAIKDIGEFMLTAIVTDNTVERCIESAIKRLRYSIGYTPPLTISIRELKYQFNQ